jgi:hypothetical protein
MRGQSSAPRFGRLASSSIAPDLKSRSCSAETEAVVALNTKLKAGTPQQEADRALELWQRYRHLHPEFRLLIVDMDSQSVSRHDRGSEAR